MACSKEVLVSQAHFECSLCLELYNKPRSLPCLHTFCTACLVLHMEKFIGALSYDCPLCRKEHQETREIGEDILGWVQRTVQPNFYIESMMESYKQKNEDIPEGKRMCEPCFNDNGEKFEVIVFCVECREYICETCQRYHKRNKTSREHILIPVVEHIMEYVTFLQSMKECPRHKEDIVFLCKTHDELCCRLCFFLAIRHVMELRTCKPLWKERELILTKT